MLEFNFNESVYKEVIDMYDAVALIGIIEYKDKEYFGYAIEWNPELTDCTFMLCEWQEEMDRVIIRDKGFKTYLQMKLDNEELYHLRCSFYGELNEIRLLEKEEATECFPLEEFNYREYEE